MIPSSRHFVVLYDLKGLVRRQSRGISQAGEALVAELVGLWVVQPPSRPRCPPSLPALGDSAPLQTRLRAITNARGGGPGGRGVVSRPPSRMACHTWADRGRPGTGRASSYLVHYLDSVIILIRPHACLQHIAWDAEQAVYSLVLAHYLAGHRLISCTIWPGIVLSRALSGRASSYLAHYLAGHRLISRTIWPGIVLSRALSGRASSYLAHYLAGHRLISRTIWPGIVLSRALSGRASSYLAHYLAGHRLISRTIWPGIVLSRALSGRASSYLAHYLAGHRLIWCTIWAL
ncbi:hypothetical protein EGW08_005227 [Elysia chlorotica]|uniref:Uncharacterized protein n=1 Tax=Elysia chlorotica TaxID=188477 RepID=A0A3S1BMC8_ELYCH|nr:hypothetical protein EGW08_005227 [Elysia chlorotica]